MGDATTTRWCECCQKVLSRRKHESPQNFTRRRFCNKRCAAIRTNELRKVRPLAVAAKDG